MTHQHITVFWFLLVKSKYQFVHSLIISREGFPDPFPVEKLMMRECSYIDDVYCYNQHLSIHNDVLCQELRKAEQQ